MLKLLPRTHAQGVKYSVLSVVVICIKIAIPGDLGVCAICKYSISVDIVEKLTSLCVESFGKVHERHKYFICWPCISTLPSTCFLLMCTTWHNMQVKVINKLMAYACYCIQAWLSYRHCSARGMCSIVLQFAMLINGYCLTNN